MKKLLALSVTLTLSALMVGCVKKNDTRQGDDKTKQLNLEDPVLQGIIKEGYSLKDISEQKDRYIVQGDIIFYKDPSHEPTPPPQNHRVITPLQARTPYLIDPALRSITVYLNAGSFSSINLSSAVDNAIAAYNAVGSGIVMSRVSDPSAANITIVENSGLGFGVCGQSGFPYSNGSPFNTIYISEPTLQANGITNPAQLIQLVAHELGHCIGLRHTNWQPLGEASAIPIPSTPASDGASVMNGGTCGSSWSGFSGYDAIAIKSLYPTAMGGPSLLNPYQSLARGSLLRSRDGRFILNFQLSDGNLVLSYYNVPLWSTNTSGTVANILIMQGDGNLVMYDDSRNSYWSSNTYGHPGAWLQLQNDGNLVIYNNGVGLWSSNTSGW